MESAGDGGEEEERCTFGMDLFEVIAEDAAGGAAQRQQSRQRELAFLTAIRAAEARDTASTFRVSDLFDGAEQLSADEVATVLRVRREMRASVEREAWTAVRERKSVRKSSSVSTPLEQLQRLTALRPSFDLL